MPYHGEGEAVAARRALASITPAALRAHRRAPRPRLLRLRRPVRAAIPRRPRPNRSGAIPLRAPAPATISTPATTTTAPPPPTAPTPTTPPSLPSPSPPPT